MSRELERTADNGSESNNLRFSQRDQLVSGFNDLPTNHAVDQSLQMGRGGALTFAPMIDDSLASSVLSNGVFQKNNTFTAAGADAGRGGIFSVTDRNSQTPGGVFSTNESGYGEPDVQNLFGRMSRSASGGRDRGDCRRHPSDDNGSTPDETKDSASDVQKLINKMAGFDKTLAKDFGNSPDGGASVLASAMSLQEQMLSDPHLAQHAQLDSAMLKMDKQLADLIAQMPGGEQMLSQMLQAEQQALATLQGNPGDVTPPPPPIEPPPPIQPPPIEPPPPPPPPPPPGNPPPGNPPPGGTDMSSIFSKGDSGVSSTEMQHAIDIANALPDDMKKVLLANGGVSLQVLSNWHGGPQGQNSGTSGNFYADSGMGDQAEVHELYEMYGQLTNGGSGSWSDSKAVSLADSGMNARGQSVYNEGDLNDTVGNLQGDGDHMSNAFTADFFAKHPGLYQDTVGQSVLSRTIQDDPALTAYIAKAQGLTDASTGTSYDYTPNSATYAADTTLSPHLDLVNEALSNLDPSQNVVF